MGVKVAAACLHWSQSSVPHPPSPPHHHPQTIASSVSSFSKRRRFAGSERSVVCRFVHKLNRPATLGTPPAKLPRSRSCELLNLNPPVQPTMRRACSAYLDSFSDEGFSKRTEDLGLTFHQSDEEEETEISRSNESVEVTCRSSTARGNLRVFDRMEPPDWIHRVGMVPAGIDCRANSFGIPLSLRITERKMQWRDGFRDAGEFLTCSSMRMAFSNMVFIIQELHRHTFKMREMLFYEDLEGIIGRVQKDMQASFVWLFQQVFSQTPTLMVYVMILLANFSVHSLATSSAFACTPPCASEEVSVVEGHHSHINQKFDFSTFSASSSSNGKSISIGGNSGGGGKFRPVSGGTDGDGRRFDGLAIATDGVSSSATTEEQTLSSDKVSSEEELLWKSICDEASRLQSESQDPSLDRDTIMNFVSPVIGKMESCDNADYFRTELFYQSELAQEPKNTLLLTNYAQFLYMVVQDYDRAEEYFKKATEVEPKDGEALNKYATFLWQAKNELWGAEEAYQAAIDAEPANSFYAASYAHFLWNTGGDDTCYPLEDDDPAQYDDI
ncbi:unnamed protein product [Cuscuta epithymum]|uniref:Tetratricopeptide repeat-like superfamily protein n=1 Tax=Cuscuta epithymum TaxID=186058 RepID=A0AAV0DXB0_9ASTE|nr:unnamed protein product [Cuscuta epithymum]